MNPWTIEILHQSGMGNLTVQVKSARCEIATLLNPRADTCFVWAQTVYSVLHIQPQDIVLVPRFYNSPLRVLDILVQLPINIWGMNAWTGASQPAVHLKRVRLKICGLDTKIPQSHGLLRLKTPAVRSTVSLCKAGSSILRLPTHLGIYSVKDPPSISPLLHRA